MEEERSDNLNPIVRATGGSAAAARGGEGFLPLFCLFIVSLGPAPRQARGSAQLGRPATTSSSSALRRPRPPGASRRRPPRPHWSRSSRSRSNLPRLLVIGRTGPVSRAGVRHDPTHEAAHRAAHSGSDQAAAPTPTGANTCGRTSRSDQSRSSGTRQSTKPGSSRELQGLRRARRKLLDSSTEGGIERRPPLLPVLRLSLIELRCIPSAICSSSVARPLIKWPIVPLTLGFS